MKLNGIKSAEDWQKEHGKKYAIDCPSIKFIRRVQADAIRVAGNTVAQMMDAGHGTAEIAETVLNSAKQLEGDK